MGNCKYNQESSVIYFMTYLFDIHIGTNFMITCLTSNTLRLILKFMLLYIVHFTFITLGFW